MKKIPLDTGGNMLLVFTDPPTLQDVTQFLNHIMGTGAPMPDAIHESKSREEIELLKAGDSDAWRELLEDFELRDTGYIRSMLREKFPHMNLPFEGIIFTE